MSELAQVASHMKVRFLPDGGTVLTQPDGSDFTVGESQDPMPEDFGSSDGTGQAALLQWQFDHSWMAHAIKVDGQPFGQPGREPAVNFASRNGRIVLAKELNGAPRPTISIPAVKPAVTQGGSWALKLDSIPAGGQIKLATNGVGAGGTIELIGPAPLADRRFPGFIRGVEKPLTTVTSRRAVLTQNGKPVSDPGEKGAGTDFYIGMDVLDPAGGPWTLRVTMPGYDGLMGLADMHLDVYYGN